MTENAWSLLMMTPAPDFAPLSSRLIRCRSTRICFSRSERSPIARLKQRFICGVAVTAPRQASMISSRWAALAQPGKEKPARFRARRTRVINTMADRLEESVSSDGVSMSDVIVMASARVLRIEGLFDLVDFITRAGGVLVTFGFDGLGEV